MQDIDAAQVKAMRRSLSWMLLEPVIAYFFFRDKQGKLYVGKPRGLFGYSYAETANLAGVFNICNTLRRYFFWAIVALFFLSHLFISPFVASILLEICDLIFRRVVLMPMLTRQLKIVPSIEGPKRLQMRDLDLLLREWPPPTESANESSTGF